MVEGPGLLRSGLGHAAARLGDRLGRTLHAVRGPGDAAHRGAQRARHALESAGQLAELVVALHHRALGEVSAGDALGLTAQA